MTVGPEQSIAASPPGPEHPATITVALAGQPNVGKSVVFNALTGLAQPVANWPGVTSEPRTGIYRRDGFSCTIVDLPGTYGLTAHSDEERAARAAVLAQPPDVVALIADAGALERNLYLLAELLLLPAPVVLGLNMLDLAEEHGFRVEPQVLEAALGLPVVPMVASRGCGVHELIEAAVRVARQSDAYAPRRPEIRDAEHRAVLAEVRRLIAGRVPARFPESWAALKLLEGDAEVTAAVRGRIENGTAAGAAAWEEVHAILRRHEDAVLAIAGGRYEWIVRMVRAAVTRPVAGQLTRTDRIDRYATHPIWGLVILALVLGVTFWLTYAAGTPLQVLLDRVLVQAGAAWVRETLAAAPPWIGSLLADGVLAGVGLVLTFLPILVIFFAVLALLEDVGYIARAAYATDRFMHVLGLHGNSFLPLFLGFGCNVPAVMASRIIDSPKARTLTIMLAPFVPCPARMTVVAVLAPAFFGAYAPLFALGLSALAVLALVVVGLILHELFLGGEHVAFIMELPLYHAPDWRAIARSIWQRLLDFLRVAGSIILVVSLLLWAVLSMPTGDIETSYLAAFGRWLAPAGAVLGWSWQMVVALLTSFVRKENTIATLGVLYGAEHEGLGLAAVLAGAVTPAAALAFMTVQMLFMPCVATVAAIRQETRSWRWTALSVLIPLVLSALVGLGVYYLARSLGGG